MWHPYVRLGRCSNRIWLYYHLKSIYIYTREHAVCEPVLTTLFGRGEMHFKRKLTHTRMVVPVSRTNWRFADEKISWKKMSVCTSRRETTLILYYIIWYIRPNTIIIIVDRGLLLWRVDLAADYPIEVSQIRSSHGVILFARRIPCTTVYLKSPPRTMYIISDGRRTSSPWPSPL